MTQDSLGAATRRLLAQFMQAQFGVPGAFNQLQPVADPQNQTGASLLSFNQTGRIVHGYITDCTAIGNVYRVQLEKNKQPVVAFLSPRTSSNLFGARELTTLLPGTTVTCIWHEQLSWAQIIGVIPPVGTSARLGNQSVIHGASRNRVDEAHKRPFRMEDGGYIPAFLAGRPFDAVNCGETGWITETGVKAFVDSFMAIFGVEESCQISFHYHDMLARLSAYNFQLWTAVREHESFNDQDETLDWTGWAMYPWEQLGLDSRADPTKILSPTQWQQDTPWYSKMEPVDDYLMPWHREREFHGYLGQGGKRCVVAPAIDFDSSGGNKGSSGGKDTSQGARTVYTGYEGGEEATGPTIITDESGGSFNEPGSSGSKKAGALHPGLFDSFVTADGRFCVQSAKGISLVKRAAIMLPTRLQPPASPAGDNEKNYRFSGILGDGPEHKITGDIETSGELQNLNRAAGIMDMHAYFFNYAGLHPFLYHKKDYKVYEESEAEWAGNSSEEVPDFGKLASEAYIDAEDYKKTWFIDHRYGEQAFYTLSCGFELLDDGGVMITDGYGGAIRMTGGSIEISAPGDIWLRSGRNVNLWAGHDAIIRSKNSFDISSSTHDGRIKAEKNLMLLGGHSGKGGVLVESRGAGDLDFETVGEDASIGGLILKSKAGPIASWSPELYLRTGGPGMYSGPIVLDANQGQGAVSIYSQYTNVYSDRGVYFHFDGLQSNGRPSGYISATGAAFPGTVCIGGGLIADGNAAFSGVVTAVRRFVSKDCPNVQCLNDEGEGQMNESFDQCRELLESKLPDFGAKFLEEVLQPRFYEERRPGNEDVILKGEFGFRSRANYRTENFVLYEDRWQQLGRIKGSVSSKWEEKAVTSQGRETYPYPGTEAFQGTNYVQQDLTIFDAVAGRAKDRGEANSLNDEYASPAFGEPTRTSLNEYLVIR